MRFILFFILLIFIEGCVLPQQILTKDTRELFFSSCPHLIRAYTHLLKQDCGFNCTTFSPSVWTESDADPYRVHGEDDE